MALQARRFFLDVQARQFVSSPDSTLPASDPAWFEEDVEAIELFFLKPTSDPNQPYEYLNMSGATIKFAVGITAPAALQTSWNQLATTVTSNVTTLVAGAAGTSEIQAITFSGATPAEGGYALQFPARNVTVSSVSSGIFTATDHGLYNGMPVTLTGFSVTASSFSNASYIIIDSTKDTFSIATSSNGTALNAQVTSGGGTAVVPSITTPQISYDATPSEVQAAIIASGLADNSAPQIAVSGIARKEFTLVYGGRSSSRDYAPVVVVGSTLSGAKGVTANVSFNTVEIAALITAGTTNVSLEVEVSEGAVRQTFRRSATLSNDLITSTVPVPVPANVFTTLQLQSSDNSVWLISATNDGELQISKQ